MATRYQVKLSVTLIPVHHTSPLLVTIGIDQNTTTINLDKTTTIDWDFESQDSCQLTIEFQGKQDQEAVIVESVSFFGIEDPKFAWAGVYHPVYPEPWATEQRAQNIELKSEISPQTYLGWNGRWTLTFEVPVFTWIHKIQNLGWIYR